MTVPSVSDVFAFVCRHAEFSRAVLFSESELTELRPQEREAIEGAFDHIKESYVALLTECRDQMLAKTDDIEFRKTMSKNKNRPDSIWDRRRVEFAVVSKSAYLATAYFWIDEEPTRPGVFSLVGEVGTQVRWRHVLRSLAPKEAASIFLSPSENLRIVVAIDERTSLRDLATQVVEPLWPIAEQVRAMILDTLAARETAPDEAPE